MTVNPEEQPQVTEAVEVEVEELLDDVAGGTYGGSSDSWPTQGYNYI
ncbi:hypothetical protein [Streptomyces fagopyri]